MRILLLGAQGQLGQALQTQLAGSGELVALGRQQLDVANLPRLREELRRLEPQLIVNAAAYTAVDRAENDTANAWRINAEAPGVLAEEARASGALLIHYSTDYVFNGLQAAPYREEDTCAPLNEYGRSKLAGEQAIAAAGGAHLILRTSWVYSRVGGNFLLTMLRLLQERDELRVVADQIGAPTWTHSLARATATMVEAWQAGRAGPWGLYHMTARGETSWFGFASAIADYLKAQRLPCARLLPIRSEEYPTAAQRPANSLLDGSKLRSHWGIELEHWQNALRACLDDHSPERGSTEGG